MPIDDQDLAELYARLRPYLDQHYKEMRARPRIIGDPARIHIPGSSYANDAQLNVNSGHIYVGEDTFFGTDVSLITCTHEIDAKDENRRRHPAAGRDIHIGRGVWIASRATVLGPCRIGDYAVVATGAVVREDVPAGALYAGVPARFIRNLNLG